MITKLIMLWTVFFMAMFPFQITAGENNCKALCDSHFSHDLKRREVAEYKFEGWNCTNYHLQPDTQSVFYLHSVFLVT